MIAQEIWISLATVLPIHKKVVEEDDVREERGKLNFTKTQKPFFQEWIHLIVYFLPLSLPLASEIVQWWNSIQFHLNFRLWMYIMLLDLDFFSVKLIPLKAYFSFESPTLPSVCCSWLPFKLIVLVRAWLRVSHYVLLMLFSCRVCCLVFAAQLHEYLEFIRCTALCSAVAV